MPIPRTLKLALMLSLVMLLGACHEPVNPLLGSWVHTAANTPEQQKLVTFTPSTMIVNGQRVTVVYQIRPDKVRVSAGKRAIIYELVNDHTIRYSDDNGNTFELVRTDQKKP